LVVFLFVFFLNKSICRKEFGFVRGEAEIALRNANDLNSAIDFLNQSRKNRESANFQVVEAQKQADLAAAQVQTSAGAVSFETVVKLIYLFGFQAMQASGEAEQTCVSLVREGIVDYCASEDGDCFLFGCDKLLRNAIHGKEKCPAILYTSPISRAEMVVAGVLAGCDYCEGLQGVGFATALKIAQHFCPQHKNPETVLQAIFRWLSAEKSVVLPKLHTKIRSKNAVTEESWDAVLTAAAIFYRDDGVPEMDDLDVMRQDLDIEGLRTFAKQEMWTTEEKIASEMADIEKNETVNFDWF
jgi:5'-3' exonuclease